MRLTIATPTNARIIRDTPRMNSVQGIVPKPAAYLSMMMRKIWGSSREKTWLITARMIANTTIFRKGRM